MALSSGFTITLVNASIFMNDDIRAKWVPVHCCFLQISLWHLNFIATTTYDTDSTFTKDIVHCRLVPGSVASQVYVRRPYLMVT